MGSGFKVPEPCTDVLVDRDKALNENNEDLLKGQTMKT